MTATPAARAKPHRDVAVAIRNDAKRNSGSVLASGHGALARQIIEIAAENGIEIREDADLAEVLAVIEVDSPIPPEVMAIVSELLGYVYRANTEELAGDS
jgi:flagellar biosynthesis protein